jgi:hypothetical protein
MRLKEEKARRPKVSPETPKPPRVLPGHLWKPGQSGNPNGRAKMNDEVKEAIGSNGLKAVERLKALLDDDKAFGKAGWMPVKEQIKVIEVAMHKAYGQAVTDERFGGGGSGGGPGERSDALARVLVGIYEDMRANGAFPEMLNALPAADATDAERAALDKLDISDADLADDNG